MANEFLMQLIILSLVQAPPLTYISLTATLMNVQVIATSPCSLPHGNGLRGDLNHLQYLSQSLAIAPLPGRALSYLVTRLFSRPRSVELMASWLMASLQQIPLPQKLPGIMRVTIRWSLFTHRPNPSFL